MCQDIFEDETFDSDFDSWDVDEDARQEIMEEEYQRELERLEIMEEEYDKAA